MADLAVLALQQRDLLAVFADAREIEAEVRLDRLLLEIERGELAADELRDAGREHRVDRRHPEQQAGNFDAEERRVMPFEDPQRMIENATRLVAEAIMEIE